MDVQHRLALDFLLVQRVRNFVEIGNLDRLVAGAARDDAGDAFALGAGGLEGLRTWREKGWVTVEV